ncbi:MAG: chorismate pyruvate-lyase family protein, partial [Thiohalocapsa sp.]
MVERYYRRAEGNGGPNPFRCEGFVRGGTIACAGCEPIAIDTLPAFLRALLVTDGTVTKMLEAYFWEPVVVDTLRQEFITAEAEIPWIDIAARDRIMVRRARLRGADSGKHYAHAFSVIRTELIPPHFRQRLIDREIGIGALIR